ncbi:MAG: SDR family NAD(P)-dependent oxidoreductase [Methylobacteriaceae bacterium]|nr:SDR family NAD(P)-dependent oxidoreductase [Methylobacteriaceae bacterium]
MSIRFDGRTAIVTGAGAGLGRAYALALAARGARVVVNDLGVGRDGAGGSSEAAERVVAEIRAAGGEAIADGADVSDETAVEAMVARALARFERVDALICNAGILRDKSFGKMTLADFRAVLDVHLTGAFVCCKAVWETMRAQGYGRILLTSSGVGLYGNFGQANYAAAKAGMIGLMHALHIEGKKHDIRVNALAPTAATRMTEGLLPPDALALMAPETITPGVLYLVSERAPSRFIMGAGAGAFARALILETQGTHLSGAALTPEGVEAAFGRIADPAGALAFNDTYEQTERYVRAAAAARGES